MMLFSNDTLWRIADASELQIKYDFLVAWQLSRATLESGTWLLMARERGDDTTNLRALLNMSTDESKLLEGQIAAFQKEKEAVSFERSACNAKVGCLLMLLRCCPDLCHQVVKLLNDKWE